VTFLWRSLGQAAGSGSRSGFLCLSLSVRLRFSAHQPLVKVESGRGQNKRVPVGLSDMFLTCSSLPKCSQFGNKTEHDKIHLHTLPTRI
jgi:hypothetical protein